MYSQAHCGKKHHNKKPFSLQALRYGMRSQEISLIATTTFTSTIAAAAATTTTTTITTTTILHYTTKTTTTTIITDFYRAAWNATRS